MKDTLPDAGAMRLMLTSVVLASRLHSQLADKMQIGDGSQIDSPLTKIFTETQYNNINSQLCAESERWQTLRRVGYVGDRDLMR